VTADEATGTVVAHRLLRRYVLPGERVVLATRRHWARLLEPAASATVVFALCGWLTVLLQPALGDRALVVWWLWVAALGRFGWRLLLWRVEWFVATDKRMLLLTGLVTHQVAMMPLMKVTDMRYSRSVLGQLLGYGEFLLESAGQDQALRRIGWVARPDATYRDLCALLFTPVGRSDDGRAHPGPAAGNPTRAVDAPVVPPVAAPAAPPVAPPAGPRTRVRTRPGAAVALVAGPSAAAPVGDEDTQPLPRVAPAPRSTPGDVAGARADDGLAWDVSEPTARHVDLGRAPTRGPGTPRAAGDGRPDRGNDVEDDGPRT
jgi:hypothetical protein